MNNRLKLGICLAGRSFRRLISTNDKRSNLPATKESQQTLPEEDEDDKDPGPAPNAIGFKRPPLDHRTPYAREMDRRRLHPDDIYGPMWLMQFLAVPRPGFSTEFVAWLQHKNDYTPGSIGRWWERKRYEGILHTQTEFILRFKELGQEIACAYFILYAGGAIKVVGRDEWLRIGGGKTIPLPDRHVPTFQIESIDLSDKNIIYEGLRHFDRLKRVKTLILSDSDTIDDYCVDLITSMFRYTLENLDLSGCKLITDNGVSCLHRFGNLKTLKLGNLPRVEHKELLTVLLQDRLAQCSIEGLGEGYRALLPKPDNPEQVTAGVNEELKEKT